MNEFFKKNKVIVLAILIIIIVLGVVLAILFSKPKKKLTQEEVLTGYLKDMGKDFYQNAYYNDLGKDKETKTKYLEDKAKVGIKIDLENLGIYDASKNKEIVEKFVNEKTKKACDKNKTYVTIYPKSPYNIDDFEVKTNLNCGF